MNRAIPRLMFLIGAVVSSVVVAIGAEPEKTPVYSPQAGRTYEYGIEIRIYTEGQEVRPFQLVQRVRLRYEILRSSDTEWSARYSTVPFQNNRPVRDAKQYQLWLQRQRELAEGKYDHPPPPNLPGNAGARINEMQEFGRSHAAKILSNVDHYPGMLNFCQGEILVASHGEVIEVQGAGQLPMLVGQVAALPLIRLPTAESKGNGSYGYKELRPVRLYDRASRSRTTDLSALVTVTPRDLTSPNPLEPELLEFGVSVEKAGGASADAQFRMTGNGFGLFSPSLGMPSGGNMNYETDALTYGDAAGDVHVQIGFQFLDPWRSQVFDVGVVPTEAGMGPELMPRLNDAELKALHRQLSAGKKIVEPAMRQKLVNAAPPPDALRLDEAITASLTAIDAQLQDMKTKRSEFNPRQGKARANLIHFEVDMIGYKSFMSQLVERWRALRQAATLMPRTWSDTSGKFQVRAQLVGENGGTVTLKRNDDGQLVSVPLTRLSEADADFVRTFAQAPPAAAPRTATNEGGQPASRGATSPATPPR